jgi:4-amino-4-deoxy-L-arabinose transferase-like glycosyltransferase
LRYVLVVETAQRVAAGTLGRTEPWWYFVPILAGAALPWTALLAGASPAVWRAVRGPARDPVVALCILWIALPLVLFSLSLSKRPQYVLPLIPAVALLAGWAWERASDRLAAARIAGGAVAAFGLVLLALATRIGPWIGVTPGVGALIPATARALGALLALTGGAAVALAARRDWPLLALAVPVSVIPVVAMPLMEAIGADRSSRSVADAVRPLLADDTEVVAVGTYPLSLPFYLGRTFTLATLDGRELTSNYVTRAHDRLRAQPGSTLRPADWWEEALAICRRPRLFVVPAGRDDLRRRFEPTLPLRATSRKVAVYGPCGPAPLARNE